MSDINLSLTDLELLLLGEALGMMPYSKVVLLMNKVQNQINAQLMVPVKTNGAGHDHLSAMAKAAEEAKQ